MTPPTSTVMMKRPRRSLGLLCCCAILLFVAEQSSLSMRNVSAFAVVPQKQAQWTPRLVSMHRPTAVATATTILFAKKSAKKRLDKNKNVGKKTSLPNQVAGVGEENDDNEEEEDYEPYETDSDETITAGAQQQQQQQQEAERIIRNCVETAGAKLLDLTWYPTKAVVTLGEYFTPTSQFWKWVLEEVETDGDDDDDSIDDDGDDEATGEDNGNMAYDDDEPEEDFLPHNNNSDEGTSVIMEGSTKRIDSAFVSYIARIILNTLEAKQEEDKSLQFFLEQYDLILSSPGAKDMIETQRQFDAFRGFDVVVETTDPKKKEIHAKLIERNDAELFLNNKGRKVAIALEKVKCVRLPPAKREKGVPRDAPF